MEGNLRGFLRFSIFVCRVHKEQKKQAVNSFDDAGTKRQA